MQYPLIYIHAALGLLCARWKSFFTATCTWLFSHTKPVYKTSRTQPLSIRTAVIYVICWMPLEAYKVTSVCKNVLNLTSCGTLTIACLCHLVRCFEFSEDASICFRLQWSQTPVEYLTEKKRARTEIWKPFKQKVSLLLWVTATIKSQKYRRSRELHDEEPLEDSPGADGKIQAGPTPTGLRYKFKFPIAVSFSSCLLDGGARVNFLD